MDEKIRNLLKKAALLAQIAHDWNLEEVELDDGWAETWKLRKEFEDAILDAEKEQEEEK